MKTEKLFLIGSIVSLILAGLGVAVALAQTNSSALPSQVLSVDSSGNTLIRGQVQSVGTDSITITSWGGQWTVLTGSSTAITPAGPGGSADPSGIAVGDFIGADGMIDSDQSWTVNATVVHDWTQTGGMSPTSSVSATTPAGNSSTSIVGTVGGIAGPASFNLNTSDHQSLLVYVDPNISILTSTGRVIFVGSLVPGDSVIVDGLESGNSIAAASVHDLSQ